jgi:hypothetical protein
MLTSPSQALRIRRRDAEDLVLMSASRAAQDRESSSAVVRMLVVLLQHDPKVRDLLERVVAEVFPWVAFLSPAEVRAFVVALVSTSRAAASIGNPAPVAQVISSWRRTAEVLADPKLSSVLTTPSTDDHGAEPRSLQSATLLP